MSPAPKLPDLVARVRLDTSDLGKAQGQIKGFTSSTSAAFGGLSKSLAAGIFAAGAFSFVKGGVQSLAALDKVTAQTGAAITSTGGAAGVTAKQVDALAQSIEDATTVEREAVQEGANMLLTFTNIRNAAGKGNDVFTQATHTLVDLATAMGGDTKGAAIQMGKALNDPIKGVTALTKVGVTFTEGQRDQIRSLVESGDIMKAQKIILAELNKEFGGSAKALGDSLQGRLNRVNDSFDDLSKSVASAALPAVEGFTTAAQAMSSVLQGIPQGALQIGGLAAGFGLASLAAGKAHKAIKSFQLSLVEVGPAGARAAGSLGFLTRLALPIASAYALGKGITSIVDALSNIGRGKSDIDGLVAALSSADVTEPKTLDLGRTSIAKLKEDFAGIDKVAANFGSTFAKTIKESTRGGLDKTLDDLDKALAVIVEGGAPQKAEEQIAQLAKVLGRPPAQILPFLDDYKKALGSSKAGAALAAVAAAEHGESMGQEGDSAEKAAEKLEKIAEAQGRLIDVQLGLEKAQVSLEDAGRGVADAEKELAEALAGVGPDAEEAASAVERLRDAHDSLIASQEGLAASQRRLADSNRGLNEARDEQAKIIAEFGGGSKEAREANEAVLDAQDAAADAADAVAADQRGLADANRDLTQAQKEESEASRGQGVDLDRVKAAQLGLRDAQLAQKGAAIDLAKANVEMALTQAEANGKTLTAVEKLALLRTELGNVAGALAEGSVLRTNLSGYIAQLASIPATLTTRLGFDASALKAFSADTGNILAGLSGGAINLSTRTPTLMAPTGPPVVQNITVNGELSPYMLSVLSTRAKEAAAGVSNTMALNTPVRR